MEEFDPAVHSNPPKKELIHQILSPEVLELIETTIDKLKMGLEIWWNATVDSMQIPIQNPATGEVMGMSEPQVVIKIALIARGYVLGPSGYVNTTLITNPIPIIPDLERGIITSIEYLNQQRAKQMNGPATNIGSKES